MKRAWYIILCGMVLTSGSLFASAVTDIELSAAKGAVVARIAVEGPIRFMHQTEVPKNGRGYRVIVDVLSADHHLSSKKFVDLPPSAVLGIRTSQFSVKPEKIVRLVFDMAAAPLYSITSDHDNIVVTFTDKDVKPFAVWKASDLKAATRPVTPQKTAKPVVAQKPVDESVKQNKAIDADRLASLGTPATKPPVSKQAAPAPVTTKVVAAPTVKESQPVPSTASPAMSPSKNKSKPASLAKEPSRVVPPPKPPRAHVTDTVFGPEFKPEPPSLDEAQPALTGVPERRQTKAKANIRRTPPASTTKQVKSPQMTPSVPQPVAPVVASAAPKKPAVKVTTKKVVASTETKAKPSVKASQKKSSSSTPNNKGQKKLAQKLARSGKSSGAKISQKNSGKSKPVKTSLKKTPARADKSSTSAKQLTSRFRRSPTRIKGTMVAEFPKRLVVKYRRRISRDPFSSLVAEQPTYEGPIEKKVPNVEGLQLVGIIEATSGSNRALLEDKSGVSYILKSGDKVRRGYVLRVEADRVYFQIFEYGWSRTIALSLDEY